jgi:fumarate hydratase class II
MNSGPAAGLAEIRLPQLKQASSIMPAKTNPVIPESARMAGSQVIGNDAVIALSNTMGDFQLNVMLPVIAHNLLQSITILGNVSLLLAERAIKGFEVNEDHLSALVQSNAMIATVLNPVIGYEKATEVVKKASSEKKTIRQVVVEMGYLAAEEADRLLDPRKITGPGFPGKAK